MNDNLKDMFEEVKNFEGMLIRKYFAELGVEIPEGIPPHKYIKSLQILLSAVVVGLPDKRFKITKTEFEKLPKVVVALSGNNDEIEIYITDIPALPPLPISPSNQEIN